MEIDFFVPEVIRAACERWISGCLTDNPVGDLSFNEGRGSLAKRLGEAGSFLFRGVVTFGDKSMVGGAICVLGAPQR